MRTPSLDDLPVAVGRVARDMRVVWGNERLAWALETPLDQIVGRTCREIGLAGVDYDAWEAAVQRTFDTGKGGRFVHVGEVRGEYHLLDYRFVPERTESGATEHLLAVAYVNQEAERLRSVLDAKERLLHAFLDHTPVFAWLRDADGVYRLVNAAYKQRYELRDQDVVGRSVRERWPGETGEQFLREDQEVLSTGEARAYVDRAPDPDGTVHTFEAVKFPVRDADGTTYVGAMAIDVTDRLSMERQLVHLERVRDLATHAAGITHDLANDLLVISAAASALDSEPNEALLADLRAAADRAVERLSELRDRRPSVPAAHERAALREVAERVLSELRGSLPPAVEVTLEPSDELGIVRGRAPALQRVVENLLFNAAEALEGEGVVWVQVERDANDDAVVLRVSDDGPGVSPAVMPTLFEPFTSTKGERRGLGLAGARSVARAHGGELTVRSVPGEGATFELRLPSPPE